MEAIVALVILALGVVTGMNLVGSYARGAVIEDERSIAHQLATELMAEALSKHFESPDHAPGSFGRNNGETLRADFDDVDDYDGWSEDPIEDVEGDSLADLYPDYSREVAVWNVELSDLAASAADGTTPVKAVEVTVYRHGKLRARLRGYRSRFEE